MKRNIVIDIDKCTGCGVCELVCSFKHSGEFNPLKSRIHVTSSWKDMLAVPIVCQQCEEAWCSRICPANAITMTRDEVTGATLVTVSEDKCVGCKMCMLVCPFGCIVVSEKGYAEKCDLCGGDPECVKFCYHGALQYIEPVMGMIVKKRAVGERILDLYKEVQM